MVRLAEDAVRRRIGGSAALTCRQSLSLSPWRPEPLSLLFISFPQSPVVGKGRQTVQKSLFAVTAAAPLDVYGKAEKP
jgi:hypothetical protein